MCLHVTCQSSVFTYSPPASFLFWILQINMRRAGVSHFDLPKHYNPSSQKFVLATSWLLLFLPAIKFRNEFFRGQHVFSKIQIVSVLSQLLTLLDYVIDYIIYSQYNNKYNLKCPSFPLMYAHRVNIIILFVSSSSNFGTIADSFLFYLWNWPTFPSSIGHFGYSPPIMGLIVGIWTLRLSVFSVTACLHSSLQLITCS